MPNVGEVRAKISGDASGFTSAAGSATAALGGLSGAFKTALGAGTAFAGAKFFQSSIEQAGEFEKEMAEVATLLEGDVNNQIGQMREQIINMSAALPKSPDELGASAYDVVSAGIEGTSDQLKVLRESAKLATGGLGSTEQAVDLMTTALNSFNFEADEAGRVANVFFKTVDEGKNTVAELSNFFGQVAPLAKQAGISFEEVNAVTAVMTRRTGNAQKAQRGLRQILNAMMKPGEDLKELFNELGVSSFPQLIDRAGGFQRALQRVKNQTEGSITEFANAVGSSRALSSALLSVGEAGEEVQKIMRGMKTDTGALEQAVREVNDTFESQLQRTLNELESFQIDIGREALPQVRDMLDLIRSDRTKNTASAAANMFEILQRGFGNAGSAAEGAVNSVGDFLEEVQRTTDTTIGAEDLQIPDLDVFQTAVEAQEQRLSSLNKQVDQTKSNIRTIAESIKRSNDLTDEETKRLESQVKARIEAINTIVDAVPTEDEVRRDLVEPTNASKLRKIFSDLRNLSSEFQKNVNNIGETVTREFQQNALFGQIGGGIAETFMKNIRNGIDDMRGEVAAMEGDFRSLFADVSREELVEKRFEDIRQAVQSKFGQAMLEREDIQEAMAAGQWEQAAEQIKDEFDEFTQEMIDIGDRLAQAGLFGGLVGGDGGQEQGREAITSREDVLQAGGPQKTIEGGFAAPGEFGPNVLKEGVKQGAKEGVKEGEEEAKKKVGTIGGVPVRAKNKRAARRKVQRARQIQRGTKGERMQAGARSRFGLNPNSSLASDDNDGFSRGLASGGSQMGLAPQGGGFSPGPQAGFGGQIQQANRRTRQALGFGGQKHAQRNVDQNEQQTKQFVQDVNKTMKRQNQFLEDVDANIQRIRRRLDRLENQR